MFNHNHFVLPILSRLVSIILALIAGQTCPSLAAASVDAAYDLITQRTIANQNAFYIYQDADSGFNHGYPSGFYGDTWTIDLKADCINDPVSIGGCSTDTNVLDRQNGTVLRIGFGTQSTNPNHKGYAGVNIEEPKDWGNGNVGIGYNLLGVTYLKFDARSPTPGGIKVQFGLAGKMTDFFHVPQSALFITYHIQVASLNLTLFDLANVHLLFAVATDKFNTTYPSVLLLDNIRFEPIPIIRQNLQNVLGFPVSNQTFGAITSQSPVPVDVSNRNVASIYESSLTLMAMSERRSSSDNGTAKFIADTFDYALHHKNHGDYLPSTNGWLGLHNAYENGDIALYNSQGSGAGQQGDIRVSGYSSNSCLPSGYCVILDGATGGNNAFAILSLISAYRYLGDTRYLDDARNISHWIVNQLTDTTNTGYGGFYLGYPDEGVKPPKPLLKGKSVENNADIFAAFMALSEIERQLGKSTDADNWANYANIAGDFVMQMFDRSRGCFYAGTVPNGSSAGAGIKPDGPTKGNDTINTYDFLDSNSFTALALAGSPRYAKSIDWTLPVQCIVDRFAQTVTVNNQTYKGFNIVTNPTSGVNGIAWEFTGQVVELMQYIDRLYATTLFADHANFYLNQIIQAQATAPFGDRAGLVASTLQDGASLRPVDQCLNTPFQCIPERVGLAATTWAIFAQRDYNPLDLLTKYTLSVSNDKTVGTITSDVGGINCGDICKQSYDNGMPVTLIATAVVGYRFNKWDGDCASANSNISCQLFLNSTKNVSANFIPTYALTITNTNKDKGTVVSNDGLINCGSSCSHNYDVGAPITLTATPISGYSANWGGDCVYANPNLTCQVTLNSIKNVTVSFEQGNWLSVTNPNIGGVITSGDVQINCGIVCAHIYPIGSIVTLTANQATTPVPGYSFGAWGGACTGIIGNTCQLTINLPTTVSANFLPNYYLTVTNSNKTGGAVTSDLGGILCGSTCLQSYKSGTPVTLTAKPVAGYTMVWGGDCSNIPPENDTCSLNMNANKNVTVNFLPFYLLTVINNNLNLGTVTSDDGKINCGAICNNYFRSGLLVTLRAKPIGGGFQFSGWGGVCAVCNSANFCTVNIGAAKSCTANFEVFKKKPRPAWRWGVLPG